MEAAEEAEEAVGLGHITKKVPLGSGGVCINYFEHFNFPAQNGISTSLGGGGGGGGIVKVNTLTNTSSRIEPLHTNGGNGGAGHAVVYWCDAGWTLVPGKEGDLCQK